MIQIKIPLPTYLIKYLKTLYGEPYHPTISDELGIYVLNILERKKSYEFNYVLKYEAPFYTITINDSNFCKRGCLISKEKEALLQKFIDNHFRKEIYRNAILNHHYHNIPYKNTFQAALNSYGITEDDLSYETIRKDFNRKKQDLQKKLIKNSENEPK
ncbi:hypothetical protein ACI75Y_07125 [Capnocytophaga stomatis]|uniref:hypothetical protein n=1 Tax=Capnocytophaga stomatis TaxID=1848904 RepID=UPI0038596801